MKKKKKKQNINKKKYLITGIIFLFVLLSGTTFAYLINTNLGDVNEFLALKNVDIEYVDGESINSSDLQLPMNDDEVEQFSTGNSFTVKNNYSKDIYLRFKLIDLNIDSSTTTVFNDGNLRYALYQGSTKIGGGTLANYDANTYEVVLLNNYMQQASTNKEYTLYVYIKDTWQNQNHFLNQNITGKIRVEGYDKELPTLASKIVENNEIVTTTPDFNTIATTDEGLIAGFDSDGETYYFRGAVEDNYVKIGDMDMLWRIVRINGDGTIRLITDDSVGESQFNSNFSSENAAGYTYDNSAPNVQDGTPSTIKTFIDNWYNENMSEYDNLIANTRYCNDTSISPTEYSTLYYGAHGPNGRLSKNNPTPTFICPNTEKTYGGEYDLKVGLISADEAAFAGGKANTNNTSYYLYLDSEYWSLTPAYHDGGFSNTLWIAEGSISTHISADIGATLPVISLRADTLYTSGDGTQSNPYVISVS